jgi:hypothetical protein
VEELGGVVPLLPRLRRLQVVFVFGLELRPVIRPLEGGLELGMLRNDFCNPIFERFELFCLALDLGLLFL